MGVGNFSGKIYQRLLEHCSTLSFPPPWNFLAPQGDDRGPVGDPAGTLAALRAEFSDVKLCHAGVVDLALDGTYRLRPELTNPLGGLVAFREHPRRSPFMLLTARGGLPRKYSPLLGALTDSWTAQKVRKGGVLFAAPRIKEVALLRALGLPATLALGISQLSLEGLQTLDKDFAVPDYVPWEASSQKEEEGKEEGKEEGREKPPDTSSPEAPGPLRPTLALLAWSPLGPSALAPPLWSYAIHHLSQARQHLGLDLAGILAWQLSPQDLENLRFRLTFQKARLVRELLHASTDTLVDFATLSAEDPPLSPAAPGAGYLPAQADLLAALAEERATGRPSQRLRQALRLYEAVVERDLIAPLQAWALEGADPVVRNAGVELATASGLLHRMSPLLLDLQTSQLERTRRTGVGPIPGPLFGQYLALTGRLGSLLRDLCQWRKG